jgi:hydroxymethylpyrimidine/phosphomethylpyrimidine kinase
MKMSKEIRTALSIAGSDSSAGAGVQADLKTFAFLGVHGMSVITCVTAQNTQQVKHIYKIPVEIIEQQIDVLYEDIIPDVVKTGMLYDEETVRCVAKKIVQYKMKTVVDPVMVATSGDALSRKGFVNVVKKELIPKAYVVTPNVPEASRLTGVNIGTLEDVKTACKMLYEIGSQFVIVKGGHLDTENVHDIVFDGRNFSVFSLSRIRGKKAHGSGCTMAALIAGLLALGKTPVEATSQAKHLLWNMIYEGYTPGKGVDVLNQLPMTQMGLVPTVLSGEQFPVWLAVKNAVTSLLSFLPVDFVPEVGINIGYSLPDAKQKADICSLQGRIIRAYHQPIQCGQIAFGASKHVASIILTAMAFNPRIRSAMNIRYSKHTIDVCKKIGFKMGTFDRTIEPKDTKSTMEWGTREAITTLGFVPDIIYDTGGIGKEPMVRILGQDPEDIVAKIRRIIKETS